MGSAHDIMQTYAGRDLHAQFPEYEGWKWTLLPAAGNGTVIYRVSRGLYDYQQQEAVLAVSFGLQPSEDTIADLLSAGSDPRIGRYLLVPGGTDLSQVPAGIRILTMASFGFVEGKLTWLSKKKNAVHYPQKEGVPA